MLRLEVAGGAGGVTVDLGDDVAEQVLGCVQRLQGSPRAGEDRLESLQASARVDERGAPVKQFSSSAQSLVSSANV